MNIIILEDEPLAAQRIKSLIETSFSECSILGMAQSNAEAKSLLEKHNPDLLLCDIHLADGMSFETLQDVEIQCPTIFITAYDEYAIQSFDHNCIDYVLKPINDKKLLKSIEKAKIRHEERNAKALNPVLLKELLGKYEAKEYKKRFICKMGNKVIFKQAKEISYFFVENKITFIQEAATAKKFMVNHNLEELEQQHLDPTYFFRINRSIIINLEHIMEMKKYNNGRLKLFTKPNENLELIVARDRVSDFKEWINQ